MKKLSKQILSGVIALLMILSSVVVLAEDEIIGEENILEEMQEFEIFGGTQDLLKEMNGDDKAFEIGKCTGSTKFSWTIDANTQNAPQKSGNITMSWNGVSNLDNSQAWSGLTNGDYVAFIPNNGTLFNNVPSDCKIVLEMDVLVMNKDTGFFLRHGHQNVSGAQTYSNYTIRAGKEINVGEWTKIDFVIGNSTNNKTAELYINGKYVSSTNMSGYGVKSWCFISPYVKKDVMYEAYADNARAYQVSEDFVPEFVQADVSSESLEIDNENLVISGIEFGSTLNDIKDSFGGDYETIYAVDSEGRDLDESDFITGDDKIAFVSQDGIYTYYTPEVSYIPGDIYKKVAVTKKSLNEVYVSNIDGITDADIVVFAKNNGVMKSSMFTYPLGERESITCYLDTEADAKEDICVYLVNGVSSFDTVIDADSTIDIDLAVESGVTVSGTAKADSDVFMGIINPDKSFDKDTFMQEEATEDYYTFTAAKADENGKFEFELVPFEASGEYTYVIYKDGKLYETTKFAPGISEIKSFKEKISKIKTASDLAGILNQDSVDGATGLDYTYYKLLTESQKVKVCGDIIKAMDLIGEDDVNLDVFGTNLKYRSLIPAMFRMEGKAQDNILNYLDTENEIFNLSGSAVEDYNAMDDSGKQDVCKYIATLASTTLDPESLQDAINVSVINAQLDSYVNHSDVYNVINSHTDILPNVMLSDYGKLTTEKITVNMKVLNTRPYKTTDDIETTLNKAIANAKDAEKKSDSGNKKTGGGGSGSGSSFSSTVPIITNDDAVEIENAFLDLGDYAWAKEPINKLFKMGIVAGKGNKIFDPAGKITREEFVKMVVEAAGLELNTTSTTFKDVNGTDWFAKYVAVAADKGITSGIGNNRFGVGQNITRQDMMVMCMYLLDAKIEVQTPHFPDYDEVSDYATDAVNTLSSMGIVNGDNYGRLNPTGDCTRAEAAKIIYMILKSNNNY